MTSPIYEQAKEAGLTDIDRWEEGLPHHPESIELMEFLMDHDINDYDDFFYWKAGGDGDNGEFLMYQMDAYFHQLDRIALTKSLEELDKA